MRFATFVVIAFAAVMTVVVPVGAKACSGAAKSVSLPQQIADGSGHVPQSTPAPANPAAQGK